MPIDEPYAISQQSTEDVSRAGTAAQSENLDPGARERKMSSSSAPPMHNYTVPSALKVVGSIRWRACAGRST